MNARERKRYEKETVHLMVVRPAVTVIVSNECNTIQFDAVWLDPSDHSHTYIHIHTFTSTLIRLRTSCKGLPVPFSSPPPPPPHGLSICLSIGEMTLDYPPPPSSPSKELYFGWSLCTLYSSTCYTLPQMYLVFLDLLHLAADVPCIPRLVTPCRRCTLYSSTCYTLPQMYLVFLDLLHLAADVPCIPRLVTPCCISRMTFRCDLLPFLHVCPNGGR